MQKIIFDFFDLILQNEFSKLIKSFRARIFSMKAAMHSYHIFSVMNLVIQLQSLEDLKKI